MYILHALGQLLNTIFLKNEYDEKGENVII